MAALLMAIAYLVACTADTICFAMAIEEQSSQSHKYVSMRRKITADDGRSLLIKSAMMMPECDAVAMRAWPRADAHADADTL